jgi:hypothetical protein
MMLTDTHGSTATKTCLNATSPTTNFTWTDQALNTDLRFERPATNLFKHRKSFRTEFNSNNF